MITLSNTLNNPDYLEIIENLKNKICENFYLLIQGLNEEDIEYFEENIIGNYGAGRNEFEINLGIVHHNLSILECFWCDFYADNYTDYGTRRDAIQDFIMTAQELIDVANKLKISNIKLEIINKQ